MVRPGATESATDSCELRVVGRSYCPSARSGQAGQRVGFVQAQICRYVPKRDRLIGLGCRAAHVFMKDAGDQTLIGEAFFGSTSLQHIKVGGR